MRFHFKKVDNSVAITPLMCINTRVNRLNCSCFQYADDTTLYGHISPRNLSAWEDELNSNIHCLEEWAKDSNLLLNEKQTK